MAEGLFVELKPHNEGWNRPGAESGRESNQEMVSVQFREAESLRNADVEEWTHGTS